MHLWPDNNNDWETLLVHAPVIGGLDFPPHLPRKYKAIQGLDVIETEGLASLISYQRSRLDLSRHLESFYSKKQGGSRCVSVCVCYW